MKETLLEIFSKFKIKFKDDIAISQKIDLVLEKITTINHLERLSKNIQKFSSKINEYNNLGRVQENKKIEILSTLDELFEIIETLDAQDKISSINSSISAAQQKIVGIENNFEEIEKIKSDLTSSIAQTVKELTAHESNTRKVQQTILNEQAEMQKSLSLGRNEISAVIKSLDDLKTKQVADIETIEENFEASQESINKKILKIDDCIETTEKKLLDATQASAALKNEIDTLIPSLKAGKLTQKFSDEAKSYEKGSWWLLGAAIGSTILLMGFSYFAVINMISHFNSTMNWSVPLTFEIITKIILFSSGVYIVGLLTNVFSRSRNLMEDYKHKAAIGDYYVAMKQYIESLLEKDHFDENQKQEYINYLKDLSVQFTTEISVPPREVHIASKSKFAKLKAKLGVKGVGDCSIENEEHK